MGKGGWLLAVLALSGCLAGQPTAAPSPAGCRLPISIGATGQAQGAFVEDPSGKVSIDPYGGGGDYDSVYSKGLSVPRHAVSAQGRLYTYLYHKVPGRPGRGRDQMPQGIH